MQKKLSTFIAVITMIAMFTFFWGSDESESKIISIHQFISATPLDDACSGLKQALQDRQVLPEKASIVMSNSQGSVANCIQTAKHLAAQNPKFMVSIGTPAAQADLKVCPKNSTLAFLAITDPSAANLVKDFVIGVTDTPPLVELVSIVKDIFPNIKSVGVVFNSGEVNSVKNVDELELILKKHDIALKKLSIVSSNDVKSAITSLIGGVDIIYLPQDNSVVAALGSIAQISKNNKIPLIANDPTSSR